MQNRNFRYESNFFTPSERAPRRAQNYPRQKEYLGDKESNMHVGAHISISDGLSEAVKTGFKIGCNTIQIFTQNQKQWKSKNLDEKEISDFKKEVEEKRIEHIASHVSYLINLASPDESIHKKSIDAFASEVNRSTKLSIEYIIFHPGSHMGSGENSGIERIGVAINRIIEECEIHRVNFLLETTAGCGTQLGYKFEHLSKIIENVKDRKIMGVCLDTCHSFCAGYDIRERDSFSRTLDEFGRIVGLDYLKAIHINDSKFDFKSKKDRHEDIGKGFLGLEPFKLIVNHPILSKLPMYLETPNGLDSYKREIKILRKLAANS